MVTKLVGKIDGKQIAFERIQEDRWQAVVPASIHNTGFYIIELEAYDEAGNYAYTTKFLLTFDPESLCAMLKPCRYQTTLLQPGLQTEASLSRYFSKLISKGDRDYDEIGNRFWRNQACQTRG